MLVGSVSMKSTISVGGTIMTSFFAQYYDHNMMDGQYGGWGFGMMLMSMLFVVAVVIGAIYLLRGRSNQPQQHHQQQHNHHRDPLDIVKERYAKGDITKEQFEVIKKDLT